MLLRSYGLRVTSIKIDPYLNIDAGTMSPFEHGEVLPLEILMLCLRPIYSVYMIIMTFMSSFYYCHAGCL